MFYQPALFEVVDIDKGIVKWQVEFFDETDEVTGVATILTMVEKSSRKKIYLSKNQPLSEYLLF